MINDEGQGCVVSLGYILECVIGVWFLGLLYINWWSRHNFKVLCQLVRVLEVIMEE